MSKIEQPLAKIFEKHRIVFWYDAKKELRADFESLSLEGIEKIEINNNEFGIKHRILRDYPAQKFLLYHEGAVPADIDNWLLDVQLAHGEFRADQASLWLSELNLGMEFADLAHKHLEFFKVSKRREKLKALLMRDDPLGAILQKMLAVCAGTADSITEILESLLDELATEADEKWQLIERSQLTDHLFKCLKNEFDYKSDNPNIKDFAFTLFETCHTLQKDSHAKHNTEILLFLKRWRDSARFKEAYEKLANQHEALLSIKADLETRDYRTLAEWDVFQVIDQKILSGLAHDSLLESVPADVGLALIRNRRQTHWYSHYECDYNAVENFILFKRELNAVETSLAPTSFAEGIQSYSVHLFKLDQLYRKTIYNFKISGNKTLLKPIYEKIEHLYTNQYLTVLNDNWQAILDHLEVWNAGSIPLQSQFFRHWIHPIIQNDNKVVVIISDALRFEAGEELHRLLRQEKFIESEIKPALTLLPSYTQLGMAALLPHETLAIAADDTGSVTIDGKSTQGTANRCKVLVEALGPVSATAEKMHAIQEMSKDELRNYLRSSKVFYLYHNLIDKTGDTRETQERVFKAVEETFKEIITVVRRLMNEGITNIIVTSDHGFIYQDSELAESDFSLADPSGEQVYYRDRRFVLGKGLNKHPGLKDFKSEDFGLKPGIEIQIPKSISRLRLQGSGSRYVHGGASLQEIVIPVIELKKKRESTVKPVEVDIIRKTSTTITTGQLTVHFYQCDAVDDKTQKRILQVGIFTKTDNKLISDTHELIFDMTAKEERAREMKVQLILSKEADKFNGQEVLLKLREKHEGTDQYRDYKSCAYVVRRSFTSDFDM